MRKVSESEFYTIKHRLRIGQPPRNRSQKTLLQIRGSRNFDEYRENVKAQHPPVKYSLADDVYDLHRQLFHNNNYVKPKSAQIALADIRTHLRR